VRFSALKAAHGIRIKEYDSLGEHSDLRLYQGWFDKKSMKVQIEEGKRG